MKYMMRALFLLLFTSGLGAQEIPLSIKGGDATTVKVDRVVIVKEDLVLVRSFPFTVDAPPGSALYFWTVPPGVKSLDKGEKLEIQSAPKGSLTISVKTVSVDFDKKVFVTRFGQITFAVGEAPGPDPPKPVPPEPDVDPTDALFPAIKAAWLADPSPTKHADRDAYAAIFREAAVWVNDLKFGLVLDVNKEMTKRRADAIGAKLAGVRGVINSELQTRLPSSVDAKISADVGRTMVAEFQRMEKLLKALK